MNSLKTSLESKCMQSSAKQTVSGLLLKWQAGHLTKEKKDQVCTEEFSPESLLIQSNVGLGSQGEIPVY